MEKKQGHYGTQIVNVGATVLRRRHLRLDFQRDGGRAETVVQA